MSVPNVGTVQSPDSIPKYAIGLFDADKTGPRKRKRLTHLTPEEKIMRRKLKNRVAAQTARDRKRMKMETLEETVQKFQQQAKELLDVNMKLLKRAEALEHENAELRNRLGLNYDANSTVSGNREAVERIKVEYDDTLLVKSEHFVTDSILSPDESADENDGRLGSLSSEESFGGGDGIYCMSTTECVSPEPAVFGEHGMERPNPLQQEAVKSSLIHSAVNMTTIPTPSSMNPIRMTSSASSNKSTPISNVKVLVLTQPKALDLRKHSTMQL